MLSQKSKRDYLMIKVNGRLTKVDPDIYYKIFSTHHELPDTGKYTGNVTGLHLSSGGYVQVEKGPGRKSMALSRFIMGARQGEYVDHINRDRLDNRRKNLRIVNLRQNQLNKRQKNSTGFFGVVIVGRDKKHLYCRAAYTKPQGGKFTFRLPDNPENRIIAAFAHDKFVLMAGEENYAPLNFPCFKDEPFRSFLLNEDLKKRVNSQ